MTVIHNKLKFKVRFLEFYLAAYGNYQVFVISVVYVDYYFSGLRQSELPALDEEDDNPYHPQRLLKVGILPKHCV